MVIHPKRWLDEVSGHHGECYQLLSQWGRVHLQISCLTSRHSSHGHYATWIHGKIGNMGLSIAMAAPLNQPIIHIMVEITKLGQTHIVANKMIPLLTTGHQLPQSPGALVALGFNL